jgi:NAD(P)-dependent dehydrogenase (short-subunit alcohol dehydrogenase family)
MGSANGVDRHAFGATATVAQVIAGADLSGRRVIVTEASSGVGLETARALASAGAEVTLAVSNEEAGTRAAEDIASTMDSSKLQVLKLDLADHSSVIEFVKGWSGPLDVLVNNAAVMATPQQRTHEGWELQFAANHLGHFALSLGLFPALSRADQPRVVVVSSFAHVNSDVLFDDVSFLHHPYDPWIAYAQSKTANILFAVEAARLWACHCISVNALNPGENAATSVLLAASPWVRGISGRYFEDCAVATRYREGVPRGVAARALDPVRAGRLWSMSLHMIATAHPESPILGAAAGCATDT